MSWSLKCSPQSMFSPTKILSTLFNHPYHPKHLPIPILIPVIWNFSPPSTFRWHVTPTFLHTMHMQDFNKEIWIKHISVWTLHMVRKPLRGIHFIAHLRRSEGQKADVKSTGICRITKHRTQFPKEISCLQEYCYKTRSIRLKVEKMNEWVNERTIERTTERKN